MAKLKVVVRRLPEGYDPELHELSRNNIREKSTGKIVDQLEELGSAEKEDLAKLCGGDKRLDFQIGRAHV